MEETSLGQPGGLTDVVHRSGREALAQHQLLGGVEQLFSRRGIVLVFSHAAYLPVGMRLPGGDSPVKVIFNYRGREMPSFFIRDWSVVRFIASFAAAPLGPPSTQPVSRSAPRMWSRSASARLEWERTSDVITPSTDSDSRRPRSSARLTWSAGPGDRMTARSMTFCNSRMLPGQGY